MPRLFVDVDDTLVKWTEPEGDNPQHTPNINLALVYAARNFLETYPDFSLVVWSGGGADYAQYWGRNAFGSRPPHFAAAKAPGLVLPDDICVDDQLEIKVTATVMSDAEFIRTYPVSTESGDGSQK